MLPSLSGSMSEKCLFSLSTAVAGEAVLPVNCCNSHVVVVTKEHWTTYNNNTNTHMHTYAHTHVRTHAHVCTQVRARTHTHTHTHTYIHTHHNILIVSTYTLNKIQTQTH